MYAISPAHLSFVEKQATAVLPESIVSSQIKVRELSSTAHCDVN